MGVEIRLLVESLVAVGIGADEWLLAGVNSHVSF